MAEHVAASESTLNAASRRGDMALLRALIPLTEDGNAGDSDRVRGEALLDAARHDRLDTVKLLAETGTPFCGSPDTCADAMKDAEGDARLSKDPADMLLITASDGAALHVDQWLIEQRHASPNARVGSIFRLTAADMLMSNLDTPLPAIAAYLHMLIQHGLDLEAKNSQGETLLQQVIGRCQADRARLLLAAGASTKRLTPAERQALDRLTGAGSCTPAG